MDLEVIETGNGGDLVKKPKDLSVIYGFENMIYLAMFGGNVEASTPTQRLESEQAFDCWMNTLLMPNDLSIQFNSETERTLKQVALNSFGRTLIEQAVKKDLDFMSEFAIVKVVVIIPATDKVLIGIQLTQPDNLQQKVFIYIWDATRMELLNREVALGGGGNMSPQDFRIFDDSFDITFE